MPTLMASMVHVPQIHHNNNPTSSNPTGDSSSQSSKTIFKKVVKYLQNQALEQKSSTLHLSPGREPQQPSRSRPVIELRYRNSNIDDNRRFSEASTYVDSLNGQRFRYYPSLPPMPQSSRSSSSSRATSAASAVSAAIKRHQYASDNILQSYDVYTPERTNSETAPSNDSKYWLVYIHGGYFRDVKVDSTSFRQTIAQLERLNRDDSSNSTTTQLEDVREFIAGYASINYRLSPHPAYPQEPGQTPNYELRNAKWPEQINDVLTALSHLQNRYGFGSNYILAGHSVGALLACLAALRSNSSNVAAPKVVVGVSGIYDFPHIHQTNPEYEEMTRNAMAPSQYNEASPALYQATDYETKWIIQDENEQNTIRNVLLAHSKDDGLVNWDQMEEMNALLEKCDDNKLRCHTLELKGQHNQIWEDGTELSRTLIEAIKMIS